MAGCLHLRGAALGLLFTTKISIDTFPASLLLIWASPSQTGFSSDKAHLGSPHHGFYVCFAPAVVSFWLCFPSLSTYSTIWKPMYLISPLFSCDLMCLLEFVVGRRYLLSCWTPPFILVAWLPCSAACSPLSVLCFRCKRLFLHTAYTQFTLFCSCRHNRKHIMMIILLIA